MDPIGQIAVPTLNEWGLVIVATLLAVSAVFAIKRRLRTR